MVAIRPVIFLLHFLSSTASLPNWKLTSSQKKKYIYIYVFLERVGAEVVECGCVVGLPEVKVNFEPLST